MRTLYLFILLQVLLVLFPDQQLLAGAWTLKKGKLWVKSSFLIQRTKDRYASRNIICGDRRCRNGQRTRFFFNGKIANSATYFDFRYGLTDRIEVQFQVPYFDISFKDDVNPERPTTTDFGDIRFGLRYRIPFKPLVTTIRIGAKAPTGFFNVDSEVVPVGDGQWDLEVSAQFGRSFWPIPVYANLAVGYRFRYEPAITTTNLDPGDEFTLRAEAGLNITKNILIKTALDGFWGQEFTAIFTDSKFKLPDTERAILYFEPGIFWQVLGPVALDASVRFSLSGMNFPAGQVVGFGVSYTFSFFSGI